MSGYVCIAAGSIGRAFLAAAAAIGRPPMATVEGFRRRIEAADIPAGADLLLSIGSRAFVDRAARARVGLAVGYHPSLLPRHPGPRAVAAAIEAGDAETGGVIYELTDDWDAGAVRARFRCPVAPGDTPRTLWDRELAPRGILLALGFVIDRARR